MTPALAFAVVWAEVRKLLSRPIAKVGLVALALCGAVGPVGMWMLAHAGITTNGTDLAASLDVSAANAIRWSLHVRNFFVIHVLLVLLAALSYAGELQARTLREDLVRPVPRTVVLLAKWLALGAWAALGLLVQLVVAGALGALLEPLHGGESGAKLGAVLLGYLVSLVSELGFAAFALCASVVARSVAGTLGAVFLFLIFERGLDWSLSLVHSIVTNLPIEAELGPLRQLVEVLPFLPSTAWAVWTEVSTGVPPSWQPWVALLVYTAVSAVVADRWFARTDVP